MDGVQMAVRVEDMESRIKSLENVVFDYNGIIPQSLEMKKIIKGIQDQLNMISTSVDQIYNYRSQFIDAMEKLEAHDSLLIELKVGINDMVKVKEDCSSRVKTNIERIMATLYGNGTPENGLTARLLQIESLQRWTLKIGIVIIGILLMMVGLEKYLVFAK
jgi:hypothetical protein